MLCERGLGIVSWFIVFIPFIFMSVITTLLLFSFGLSPNTGKVDPSNNIVDPTPKRSDIEKNELNALQKTFERDLQLQLTQLQLELVTHLSSPTAPSEPTEPTAPTAPTAPTTPTAPTAPTAPTEPNLSGLQKLFLNLSF